MSNELIQYCKAENNINYYAEMITNGLIFKSELFKKLVRCEVTHYQITLDGLPEVHTRRVTKAKTFDIIFK